MEIQLVKPIQKILPLILYSIFKSKFKSLISEELWETVVITII